MLINDMVDIFITNTRKIILHLVNGYMLTSPCHNGIDLEATGSRTLIFQCINQLVESQKKAMKFKIMHVAKVGECYD